MPRQNQCGIFKFHDETLHQKPYPKNGTAQKAVSISGSL